MRAKVAEGPRDPVPEHLMGTAYKEGSISGAHAPMVQEEKRAEDAGDLGGA